MSSPPSVGPKPVLKPKSPRKSRVDDGKKADEAHPPSKLDVLLSLETKRQALLKTRETTEQRSATLAEWIAAPDQLATDEAEASQRRDQALQDLAARLAQERKDFESQRQAARAEATEHDALEEAKGAEQLERLQQAVIAARARLAAASDFAAQHEAACAEARRAYEAAVERLREEEASQLQALDGVAVTADDPLAKGTQVFAKKKADDPEFLSAHIEVAMSTGKYLVVFDESKQRTIVAMSLLRRTAPQPMGEVVARFAVARDDATQVRDKALRAADNEYGPTVDLTALQAELEAADAELKKKTQFLDVKRKKAREKQQLLEESQAAADEQFEAQQQSVQDSGPRSDFLCVFK
jgi:hypothetical protein